jgi:hypothetical protein
LMGVAVVIMLLIIWEEILFSIKIKEIKEGMIFRIRRKKLKTQILLYCVLPLIFGFIYLEYDLKISHFIIWVILCMGIPAVEIISSASNTYNTYLKLTNNLIKYRNNKKEGTYKTEEIRSITMLKDERGIFSKIQLLLITNDEVMIDLDEMHLYEFFDSIHTYIKIHYKDLLTEPKTTAIA